MKLDYLQFLELEVFTRFGARLEASIEAKIKRGRMLREVLKQDRPAPLPVEFEMAWLVAFNDGLLNKIPASELPAALERLTTAAGQSGLRLEDRRETWAQSVAGWLSIWQSGFTTKRFAVDGTRSDLGYGSL